MGKYITEIETRFIEKNLNPASISIVMDVGAEAGRFSQLNTNIQTISIDINKQSLKRLQKKAPNTYIIQADARQIPIKNGVFDAITMIEVLDYIPELQKTFCEAYRTLKPETSLILSFGNKSSLKAKLRKLGGKSYLHKYGNVSKTLKETEFTLNKKTGYSWLMFGRMSQNPLIPTLAKMENAFGFRKIPSVSPWVLIQAVKQKPQTTQ